MHNTGTIYSSTERSPTVLPEMAELLPPLTGEQLAALEADILKNGCYSPVIVNEDMVIVDGHNRQEKIECFAEELEPDPVREPDKGRGNQEKKKKGHCHDR